MHLSTLTRPMRGALALALAFGLSAGLAAAPAFADNHVQQNGRLYLTVRGEASAAPDLASVTVGVATTATAAGAAMAEQATKMSAVFAAVVAAGVAERDMRTSGIELYPVYAELVGPNDTPRITGYRVANRVTVLLRDVTKVGATLDALVGAGANEVQGVAFSITDPRTATEQARKAALSELEARRAFYAANGVSLGRLIDMTELPSYPTEPMYRAEASSAAATPIAPGEQTIAVELSVSYEILPPTQQ